MGRKGLFVKGNGDDPEILFTLREISGAVASLPKIRDSVSRIEQKLETVVKLVTVSHRARLDDHERRLRRIEARLKK